MGSNGRVKASRSEVVRVDERYLPELTAFFRTVWTPEATVDGIRDARARLAARNLAAPGEEIPTFLFLLDGRAIGHLSTIPLRLAAGGSEWPAHWFKGFWVLSEHRNGPVGALLIKEALRHLDCVLATVVDPAPRRLFGAFGFADLGTVGDFVRIFAPTRVIRRLDLDALGLSRLPHWLRAPLQIAQRRPGFATIAGTGVGAASWLWSRTAGRGARGVTIESAAAIDVRELDELWRRVAPELMASPIRDGSYLNLRYAAGLETNWKGILLRDASALTGFAAVRLPLKNSDPRLRGIRVAILSDAIFSPSRSDLGLALLAAAEDSARTAGADLLLCAATHPAFVAILRRRGYLTASRSLHLLARDPDGKCGFPEDLSSWWITRADGNADEGF